MLERLSDTWQPSPEPARGGAKEICEEDPIDFNSPQTAHRDKGLWLFTEPLCCVLWKERSNQLPSLLL